MRARLRGQLAESASWTAHITRAREAQALEATVQIGQLEHHPRARGSEVLCDWFRGTFRTSPARARLRVYQFPKSFDF